MLRSLLDGEVTLAGLESAKAAAVADKDVLVNPTERKNGKEEELGGGKGFKKASGFKSSFKRVDPAQEAEDLLRETLGSNAGPEDNLDGEPMDEDLDGEPMVLDADIDGEPMEDDDLDGEPM